MWLVDVLSHVENVLQVSIAFGCKGLYHDCIACLPLVKDWRPSCLQDAV